MTPNPIDAADMKSLAGHILNMAAHAHAEGRYFDYGILKAAGAYFERAADLSHVTGPPPPPPAAPPAKRGRPPKSAAAAPNGTPASVSDLE